MLGMKETLAVIGIRGFPDIQGGVESHCMRLIPKLGIKCHVYRRKPYVAKSAARKPHDYSDITFVDLPSTKIKGVEALLHTLLCALHLMFHPVRTVNVHNIGPGLFAPLLRLAGMNVVLTYHSANYLQKSKWGPMSRTLLRICERVALRYANRVIFVNPAMMNAFGQRIRQKSVAIPNAIDMMRPTDATDEITRWGLVGKKYILGVGRISPEKGFDLLIEASELIPEEYTIVIAGGCDNGNDYANRLKSMASGRRIIFTGYATGETLRQLYSHASLFALPSRNEGLSIALLEAMSYGLDIVAGDIPQNRLPELSDDNFFRSGSASDLARKINEKLSSGIKRRDYDLSAYDAERMVEATRRVYSSLQ